MKAMVCHQVAPIESSPLRLAEVADPQPGPGQVRLRVRTCGCCRTDLHVIEGDLEREKWPIIPGHEIVGEVETLGEGATRFRPGQRVGVAWLRHTCGQCDYCVAGRENLCPHSRYTGYHADGGYAELAVVDEDYAYELPDAFDDAHAAPLLCAGIVGYRALKRANLPAGGKLAIYGFGSSAHLIAQIALARGAELYVVTRAAGHQRHARQLGAAWAGEDAADLPTAVDSAIIFAPAGSLVPPALQKLRPGGTLSLAGIHMSDIPTLNYDTHLFHERDIHSVESNTRDDGRDFLAAAADAKIDVRVSVYPLAEANRALQDIKASRVDGSAVLRIS